MDKAAKFIVTKVTVDGDRVGMMRVSPTKGVTANQYTRIRTPRLNKLGKACQEINPKGFCTEDLGVWTWNRYPKKCHGGHEPNECEGGLWRCRGCHRWFCQRGYGDDDSPLLCNSCAEMEKQAVFH